MYTTAKNINKMNILFLNEVPILLSHYLLLLN